MTIKPAAKVSRTAELLVARARTTAVPTAVLKDRLTAALPVSPACRTVVLTAEQTTTPMAERTEAPMPVPAVEVVAERSARPAHRTHTR